MGELTPDGCSDLCYLLGGAKPVKPRHQGGVKARRNCLSAGWNAGGGLLRLAFALRFQHGLGHFLDKQRYAVRALDNVLSDVRRQHLVPGDAVDDGGDFALSEPVESDSRRRGGVRSTAVQIQVGK